MSKGSTVRLFGVCARGLCLVFALVFLNSLWTPAYWAESAVMMQPFTNTVFSRAFEKQTIKAIPAVIRLTVVPGFTSAAAGMAWRTNKLVVGAGVPASVEIRIRALGSSPEKARLAANDAASQLCTIVQRQYGGRATVSLQASMTGRWLLVFELKLRLERILNAHF